MDFPGYWADLQNPESAKIVESAWTALPPPGADPPEPIPFWVGRCHPMAGSLVGWAPWI
jgi:hypothetical protein